FDQIELNLDEENLQLIENVRTRGGGEVSDKEPKDSESDPNSTKSGEIKTISGGVLNGKAVDLPKPAYPAAARAVRASGAVNVEVTVDQSGNVISANAVSGHPLLRASAVSAARSAKFKPTLLSGTPVKVSGVIVYNFVP
ncbi:MAG: TonB family protein, partial [Pyrinomonadaceae bacterium]